MASAAPPKHSSPRQTVQSPADSDHSIMPTPRTAPTTMRAQGFASYSVRGVQERMRFRFYSGGRLGGIRLQLRMAFSLSRLAQERPWALELLAAVVGLVLGVTLMPVLIFYAGVAALGRFDGASLGHLYASLFEGLREASIASWMVFLGPYGLYVLFRALHSWWRASARLN
jgi:hypothetical protein